MLKKFIKFGITGGLGTVTNLILFFIFADLLKLPANPVSIFCFIFCATQNYIINHLWTFRIENNGEALSFKLWFKFLTASLCGFLINLSVLNILLYCFEWKLKVIPQGIGILCGMVINFLFSNYFVFKSKKESPDE